MISVKKEIIKDLSATIIMTLILGPLTYLLFSTITHDSFDVVNVEEIADDEIKEAATNAQNSFEFIMLSLPIFIILMVILNTFRTTRISQIVKTANIEKRMEKLRKLGADKFIKKTQAVLLDESERGNKLYCSSMILLGEGIKFLVYKDKSTDREYISFVEDNFENADEAMASKFSLCPLEYSYLKLENEA